MFKDNLTCSSPNANLISNSDLARIFDDPELTGIGLRPLSSAAASTVADSFLEYSAKQESFV